jgi:lysophospholipase L1-like esterase
MKIFKFIFSSLVFSALALSVHADTINYSFYRTFLLNDINGDGQIKLLAFGDSITRGVGDFIEPGETVPFVDFIPNGEAGYPLRIELWLNIPVENRGVPGERISIGGLNRFVATISSSEADYVIISEGANDAFSAYADNNLSRDIQVMINITYALGKEPILMTIPPPCCNRSGLRPFVESYNLRYRDLASVNKIPLADSERGFNYICNTPRCNLLNIPEGLHPNSRGYDVMGELIAASFYGIDLFSQGGSNELAQVLGIPETQLQIQTRR